MIFNITYNQLHNLIVQYNTGGLLTRLVSYVYMPDPHPIITHIQKLIAGKENLENILTLEDQVELYKTLKTIRIDFNSNDHKTGIGHLVKRLLVDCEYWYGANLESLRLKNQCIPDYVRLISQAQVPVDSNSIVPAPSAYAQQLLAHALRILIARNAVTLGYLRWTTIIASQLAMNAENSGRMNFGLEPLMRLTRSMLEVTPLTILLADVICLEEDPIAATNIYLENHFRFRQVPSITFQIATASATPLNCLFALHQLPVQINTATNRELIVSSKKPIEMSKALIYLYQSFDDNEVIEKVKAELSKVVNPYNFVRDVHALSIAEIHDLQAIIFLNKSKISPLEPTLHTMLSRDLLTKDTCQIAEHFEYDFKCVNLFEVIGKNNLTQNLKLRLLEKNQVCLWLNQFDQSCYDLKRYSIQITPDIVETFIDAEAEELHELTKTLKHMRMPNMISADTLGAFRKQLQSNHAQAKIAKTKEQQVSPTLRK